jgi:hypothetical protein
MWRRRDSILLTVFLLLLCGWVLGYVTPFGVARLGNSVSWQLASSEGQIGLLVEPQGQATAREMPFVVGHNVYLIRKGPKDINVNILGFTVARLGASRVVGDEATSAYTFVGIPYWFIEGLLVVLFCRRFVRLRRGRQSGFEMKMPDRDCKTVSPQKDD